MIRRLLELVYGLYAILAFGVVIFVLTSPLILLLPKLWLRRQAGRAGANLAMLGIGSPLHVRGLEHLPAGPCLVVCNHASYLDGVVLTGTLPWRFTFVVQDGAEDWPVVGPVIRRMGVSFISRENAREAARQTRTLVRQLKDGDSLVVFPEGTFKAAPGLLRFRIGAFLMAAHAGVPVVPAVIRGTRDMYGEGRKLPRHSRLEVELFPSIAPEGAHREAALQLHDRARAAVLAHCGEPDAANPDAGRAP